MDSLWSYERNGGLRSASAKNGNASFANFGSMAILIGGVSSLAPDRKKEVIDLGMKSLLAGFLAGLTTASVSGILSYQ